MSRTCPARILFGLALFFCFVLVAPTSPSDTNFVVKGTLICLDNASKEIPCQSQPIALGLKDITGKIYPLKMNENVEALFTEKRLRTREFKLTLRKGSQSAAFSLIKALLIRDGKVYEFHYFCDVCNITTFAPGLCMCCREPTEYRETLVE